MIKDKKFLEKIATNCIDKAKKLGATDCEVTVSNNISETVNFRNKNIDESKRSDVIGIEISTYIQKKKSNISSSNINEDNLDSLITRCIEMTKITPEDEYNSLPNKDLLATEHKDLELYDEISISNEKKIDYLKQAEESAFQDKRITNTEGSSFIQDKSNFVLANSLGFSMGYQSSIYSASCDVIAKSNGSMERDYEYTQKRFFSDLKPPETLGNEAAERAIKKLNPKKIKSEKIPIIFEQRVAKSLLDPFANAISASSFARGTSFLKDKLNKNIFSKDINIIDDPLISKALGSQIFDSEGVKSNKVTLVKEGSLKNLLLDTYYGKILKMESNGRSGGTTNLYFENGTKSCKELLNAHTKSLYINELIGRSANIVTGDYSVGASGMLIENGEFSYPINEITIAGNLSEMFNNITLANDLEFSYATNSPTLMIEGMVLAG